MHAINLFLDRPVALFVVLAIGASIGIAFERVFSRIDRDRRRAYWAGRKDRAKKGAVPPFRRDSRAKFVKGTPERAPHDPAEQLRCVMEASFNPRPLLNKAETQVFRAIAAAVQARNQGWQVLAQVSLGEFLASPDPIAFGAINSKRVDFALIDETCRVRHVVEYQGTGHYLPGGSAAARDAIKKEALRKAGVGYHEVVAGHTMPSDLRLLMGRLMPPADKAA